MALKHQGKLQDIRTGHGTERGHDFKTVNPENKFDREPIEPRSADQVRRVRTVGETEARTGKLTAPKDPPHTNPGPQKRRVH